MVDDGKKVTVRSSAGGSFTTLLTILFIGLKLGGVIDWSWVWVLSPLWISAIVSVTVLAVMVLIIGVGALVSKPKSRF